MPHSLTIDLPENVFSSLTQLALQRGETPETLAGELISQAVQQLESDPLLKWAGAIDCEITDVADRHDHYIGEAVARELRRTPDE
jgi:hypothetical protein